MIGKGRWNRHKCNLGRALRAVRRAVDATAAAACFESLEPRRLVSGSISGTVTNDLNGNGLAESAEPPLAGWTVYLDANRNRVRDVGESTTTTDSDGHYSFTDLAAETYYVGEALPPSW